MVQFADLHHAIYNTKWYDLSISTKKNIMLMMVRSLRPIIFTSGFLAVLSLDSFKSVSNNQSLYKIALIILRHIVLIKDYLNLFLYYFSTARQSCLLYIQCIEK